MDNPSATVSTQIPHALARYQIRRPEVKGRRLNAASTTRSGDEELQVNTSPKLPFMHTPAYRHVHSLVIYTTDSVKFDFPQH